LAEIDIQLIATVATLIAALATFYVAETTRRTNRKIAAETKDAAFEIARRDRNADREIARKARYSAISATRRKERIDNIILHYSKLSALAHPETIHEYMGKDGHSYPEKILEACNNLNMLFDHTYEQDTKITYSLKIIADKAIAYYSTRKQEKRTDKLQADYEKEQTTNINKVDMLINVFVGTEWHRIKVSLQTGETVVDTLWQDWYDEGIASYEKWAEKCKIQPDLAVTTLSKKP
jgi:ferritin